ncbi:citrulline utilization hydrolase CtlX [Kiloniella litopenaei]|uniref:citrulline utilization hydrolase CtlX n=1 Tax=Kiloniella litopenaei TaxID=1549748 RepID=UPI003BA9F4D9
MPLYTHVNSPSSVSCKSSQTPSAVVLIRPHHFIANPETAADNSFQTMISGQDVNDESIAFQEVSGVIDVLKSHGVDVHVFEDESHHRPDSVFPNNWFSTHAGGHVAIYPMTAVSRRQERRLDIIDMLKQVYRVQEVVDYSGQEQDGRYLEGTGAMVLDHVERVAYVCQSRRSDPVLLERFCSRFNYEPVIFDASDAKGNAVYHTNVLMCIASDLVLVGAKMIRDDSQRAELLTRLEATGRRLIKLSEKQISSFAGNMFEVQGDAGRLLLMSSAAYHSLTKEQIDLIQLSLPIVKVSIPTIEKAGGSIRCMLAGIHLSKRL